jgi:hypothetical protein
LGLLAKTTTDERGQPLNLWGSYADQIAYSNDGTLAFIAGSNGNIYTFDTQTLRVVHTLHVVNSSARLTSLAVVDGWLYATEGSSYGASGGRLIRININQLSPDFLLEQQVLQFGAQAPYGFRDLAVNNGSYLALAAPVTGATLFNLRGGETGNVYVLDLGKIDRLGNVSSVITLGAGNFPVSGGGRSPSFISSGIQNGEFLLSNAKNSGAGVNSITVEVDGNGNLTGNAKGASAVLTPRQSDPGWLQRRFQQNIQRSAGNVVVQYQNTEYALVADYNFIFNDSHYNEWDNYGFGKQIGGKIGIIRDPFGKNGSPQYLGATTPIVGGAVEHLTLSADGKLYADVFLEEITDQYDRFLKTVFVWDAAALIQTALAAEARGQKLTIPTDRVQGATQQIPAATPARFNGPLDGELFGWTYGIGSYIPPAIDVRLTQQQITYPIATTGPFAPSPPNVVDNVYTRALGITDSQIDREIEERIKRGDSTVLSAAAYAGKVLFYDAWNFFTAGFVGRQGERYEQTLDGTLSDSQYYTSTLVDSVATVGSIVVAGRVGGAVTGRLGGGLIADVAGGAAAGAAFDITQQTGQVANYQLTDGRTGQISYSVSQIANSTVAGGGLAFLGGVMSRIPRGNYKIVWNSPSASNPAPFRLVSPQVSAEAGALRGTLADSTGGSVLADAGGTLRTPNNTVVQLPKQGSMTTEEAAQWLASKGASIPEMLNTNASLRQQAFQAVELKNTLAVASRNAMKNANAAAQLNITHPQLTFEEMLRANSDRFAGDALYKKVIQDAARETAIPRAVTLPGGCFIAGTLVHTKEGLVPIEKISVGDWVLSQPETTGAFAYKRVARTITFENKEVVSVDFATADSIGTVVATGNHPFWVKGVGWTRADLLKVGEELELKGGVKCTVFNRSPVFRTDHPNLGWIEGGFGNSNADGWGRLIDFRNGHVSINYDHTQQVRNDVIDRNEGDYLKTCVYNLEIEDFHTYYVGELGVWVHNTNCGDIGVSLVEASAGVRPSPATRVYRKGEANALPGVKQGVIFVEEPIASLSDPRIKFQSETQGAMQATRDLAQVDIAAGKTKPVAWSLRSTRAPASRGASRSPRPSADAPPVT